MHCRAEGVVFAVMLGKKQTSTRVDVAAQCLAANHARASPHHLGRWCDLLASVVGGLRGKSLTLDSLRPRRTF
jgi:hypothetical protein